LLFVPFELLAVVEKEIALDGRLIPEELVHILGGFLSNFDF